MLMVLYPVSDRTCVRRDSQHILRETRAESSQKSQKMKRTKRLARDHPIMPRRSRAALVVLQGPHVTCACMKAPDTWCPPGPCSVQNSDSQQGLVFTQQDPQVTPPLPQVLKMHVVVLWTHSLEKSRVCSTGTAWMAPIRDGPERPWECPGFQLTVLKTAKERLLGPNAAALSAAPICRRRRYK